MVERFLDFVVGRTGVDPILRARVGEVSALVGLIRLVRQLHDLTAGTVLAGAQEVVFHHDLDPRNTVYREQGEQLLPVALIDWDLAAPGRRVHDSPALPGSSCHSGQESPTSPAPVAGSGLIVDVDTRTG